MYLSQTISLSIARPYDEVLAFLADPETYPRWASVSGTFVKLAPGLYRAEMTYGPRHVAFRIVPELGIIDHAIYKEGGTPRFDPLRVIPNGEGTELIYTFLQREGTDEALFASTVEWIRTDLLTLKSLLESRE